MIFAGKTIKKSDLLRDAKAIVYFEDKYYASSAIYSLLETERGDSLKHLVLNLRVVDVDDMENLPDEIFEARPVGS